MLLRALRLFAGARAGMHESRQCQERRVSPDGEAYTRQEFLDFFGEADGQAWWSSAKPEAALVEPNESTNKHVVQAALSQAQVVLKSCSQQSFEAMLDQSCEELLRSASKDLLRSASSKTLCEVLPGPSAAVPTKPAQAFAPMLDQSCADLLRSASSQTLRRDPPVPPAAASAKQAQAFESMLGQSRADLLKSVGGKALCEDAPAVPSMPPSARVVVPKLQLPKPEAEPFQPLIRPSLISSIGSDDGTCTVESTPCHSIDRPLFGRASGTTPHGTADKFWLGRPSEESCISHIRGRASPSEALTRCPSAATSSPELQEGEREMLRKFEDENLKLREALNVEKQRVLDLKLADQNRRGRWRHELQKLEAELADKRSLEARCAQLEAEVDRLRAQRSPTEPRADPASGASPANSARLRLHQVVSLFIMHVREPLSTIRNACAELSAEDACPECPKMVEAGAADGEHVESLGRVLEVLRCYDKACKSAKARPARTTSGQLGTAERGSAGRSFEPMLPEPDNLSLSVTGVAAAGGRKVLQTLDETVEDLSDWFLGEYQRGLRGDGYNEVVPKERRE